MNPRLRETLVSLALCAFAYLFVSPYYPAINNPNENVRFYMTAAIVEEGRYEIDNLRKRWGYVNDAATRDGHVYSVKAPGTSLLGVPAYAMVHALSDGPVDRDVALALCRITATVLPTLLFLFFFHRFLGRTCEDRVYREAVFFSVALGSLLYGYGLLFVSHTLSAACAFGAFMLLSDGRQPALQRSRCGLAGLLAAAVTLFEYPGLVASLALCALAAHRLRKVPRCLLAFAAGALLPTLSMMHFQYKAFGSPFTPGHLYVENPAFRAAHQQGMYGAVGISGKALYGLLLDPGAGLLPLTPLLALAPVGAIFLLRSKSTRPQVIAVLGVIVGTILVIASMNNWRGGWTIGPRYLAVCVPFCGWLSLVALNRAQTHLQPLLRIAAVGCLGAGLVMSFSLGAYYPHLPKEITQPVRQLLLVLIEGGYAPRNALGLLGVYGNLSMLPLLLCAITVLARSSALSIRTFLPAALLTGLLAVGFNMPNSGDKPPLGALRLITRTWSPAGHDRASELRADLLRNPPPTAADLARLEALYRAQGRTAEADRVARRNDL